MGNIKQAVKYAYMKNAVKFSEEVDQILKSKVKVALGSLRKKVAENYMDSQKVYTVVGQLPDDRIKPSRSFDNAAAAKSHMFEMYNNPNNTDKIKFFIMATEQSAIDDADCGEELFNESSIIATSDDEEDGEEDLGEANSAKKSIDIKIGSKASGTLHVLNKNQGSLKSIKLNGKSYKGSVHMTVKGTDWAKDGNELDWDFEGDESTYFVKLLDRAHSTLKKEAKSLSEGRGLGHGKHEITKAVIRGGNRKENDDRKFDKNNKRFQKYMEIMKKNGIKFDDAKWNKALAAMKRLNMEEFELDESGRGFGGGSPYKRMSRDMDTRDTTTGNALKRIAKYIAIAQKNGKEIDAQKLSRMLRGEISKTKDIKQGSAQIVRNNKRKGYDDFKHGSHMGRPARSARRVVKKHKMSLKDYGTNLDNSYDPEE